jgi:hypothetical protein
VIFKASGFGLTLETSLNPTPFSSRSHSYLLTAPVSLSIEDAIKNANIFL